MREILCGLAGVLTALAIGVGALTAWRIPAIPGGRSLTGLWRYELDFARGAGVGWLAARRWIAAQAVAALVGGTLGWLGTGLAVLAAVGAAAALAGARGVLAARWRARRSARQDAVIESVRLLRQLLEAGGVGVQQALAVLGRRGPVALRHHFASIAGAAATGRQREAWASARAELRDPMFDQLAAAVRIQRPTGGELGPLLGDLEAALGGLREVVLEAEALQVQARGAAAIIALLPIAFLSSLAALRSPYLEPYRRPPGQAFLAAMLLAMGLSYLWILRWLRMPAEPRLGLLDD